MVYQVGGQDNGVTDARGRSMDLPVGLSHVIHQDEETMMKRMLMEVLAFQYNHLSLPFVQQVNDCPMQPGPFHRLSEKD